MTDVARRHANTWRRELERHGAFRPNDRQVFLPIAPPPALPGPVQDEMGEPRPDPVAASATVPDGEPPIEIVLGNGRRLCVRGGVDDAALARLIRVVEGA